MSITDTMTDLFRRAEDGEVDCLKEARDVLANALVNGDEVDETKLQQLAIRAGKNARTTQSPYIFRWSPLMTAIADYLEHKQVAMGDGRCATKDGWNYENAEPVCLERLFLPAELYHRLQAHAMKMLERGDLMDLKGTLIEKAVREYLDRNEF